MLKNCTHCSAGFEITQDDLDFYDKVSPVFNRKKELIPPPTLCPECRQQRRLAVRNERNLYHRKCDMTGKQIISMYAPQAPFPVFEKDVWWSDKWDPLSYGRDIDFSQSFFEQFQELQHSVPRPSLYQKNVEHSDYTNHVDGLKNGYLCVDTGGGCEDIYFSKWILASKNLVDCYQLEKSELCNESLYCVNSHQCVYIYLSDDCSDSQFLYDCQSCSHCFMCSNLRHKKFCFENEQLSEQEYQEKMQLINLGSFATFETCRTRYLDMLSQKAIHRDQALIHCEDCSGDMLYACKNVRDSFEVIDSQDCRFCHDSAFLKDCYDVYEPAFDCELQYESYACNHGKNLIGTCVSYDVSNLYYCDSCHNSRDLFGCISLQRNQYCILNKQYSREEYERLVPKIIKQMKLSGEWGEFFPITLSPFAYNESVAQESFPITKEEAAALGYRWYEKQESSDQYLGPSVTLPDDIRQISDDISKQILICEATFKTYKIIPQELKFYREMDIPIPRKCPDQRHKERMALRNPRKLWNRECAKCQKAIQTTYAPERPEIVYCEDCYLQTVY